MDLVADCHEDLGAVRAELFLLALIEQGTIRMAQPGGARIKGTQQRIHVDHRKNCLNLTDLCRHTNARRAHARWSPVKTEHAPPETVTHGNRDEAESSWSGLRVMRRPQPPAPNSPPL